MVNSTILTMLQMSYNGTEQKTTAEDFFDCVPRPWNEFPALEKFEDVIFKILIL